MTHYAWTIKANNVQQVQKVTTRPELRNALQLPKLPGTAPPTWLTMDPWREELSGDRHYVYDEGGSIAQAGTPKGTNDMDVRSNTCR